MTSVDIDLNLGDFVQMITRMDQQMRGLYPVREGWRYQTLHEMLLDLGTPRRAGMALPEGIAPMEMGHCYENAHNLMLEHDLTYVEGLALITAVPVQHAWCETADGTIVDPTWVGLRGWVGVPFDAFYVGVRFETGFKIRESLRRNDFPILGGYDVGTYVEHGFITNADGLAVEIGGHA